MSKAGATSGAALFLIFLLAATLSGFGLLRPANQFISDLRFDTRNQPVSGDLVFVAIDASSLASIGVWPWPRTIHARIIDALMEAGAHDVVVDIDFSTLSTPDNDAALVAALERAGGYAYLAAFIQAGENGSVDATIPAEPFRALADMVAVNVNEDTDGIARSMPYAIVADDRAIPSMAGMVTRNRPEGPEVTIDYGIDASTITILSAIDVIEGRIERDAVAGRTAVVGASALELQDTLRSPNQGVLPGSVIQILAAETVAQQRVIRDAGPVPALLVFAALLSILAFLCRGWSLAAKWLLAASVAAVVEVAAIAAYHGAAIMVATAPLHGGVFGLVLFYLLNETRVLQFVIDSLRGERDRMRLILNSVVADNFDGIVIISADWRILSASAFAEGWLGRNLVNADARKVLPVPLVRAVAAGFETAGQSPRDENGARDVAIDRPRGRAVAEYVVTVSRPTDGGVSEGEAVACLTFRDVTARREHEARLQYLAEHDELTGALARASFVQLVDADLAAGQPVNVLVFNLRRFKSINATLGHQAGDDMLCQVVLRLKDAGYDRIGRLGADTFAVAIRQDAAVPDTVFNQIAKVVVEPYRLDGHGATIGIAGGWASGPAGSGATLLRRADLALAKSRLLPGNCLAHYAEALDVKVHQRRQLETEMRQALDSGQFTIVYQPQIGESGTRLVGAEALLRWNHPRRGFISPLDFLPVAEETGLIAEIGRMVLVKACREALNWPGDIRVAVNVSPLQFELVDMLGDVRDALERTGLPPERLELEITEGLLLQHQGAAADTLRALSALGVKIAIDDFGTGFSSLAYLSQLPFDVLKIDKSFVDAMIESDTAARIVETIIQLGRQLDKCVLAEGVETLEQVEMLGALGCDVVQGYYYGRPGAPQAIVELASSLAGRRGNVEPHHQRKATG